MDSIKCPICNSQRIYKSFTEKNYNLSINVCNDCYMIYQEINNDINYYDLECRTQDDYEQHAKNVADYIYDFVGVESKKVKSILEVGAFSHLVLNNIKKHYKHASKLCGLDLPSGKNKIEHINGIRIIKDNCIDNKDEKYINKLFGEKYDFIFCRHTLEHFINPILAIKNIKSLMNDDGLAFFEVPSFYWTEVNGVTTYHPEHLLYFTQYTLTQLFESCGFHVVKIKESKYWGNIKILVKKNKSKYFSLNKKINSIRRKWVYMLLQPIFVFIKRNKKINPNQ